MNGLSVILVVALFAVNGIFALGKTENVYVEPETDKIFPGKTSFENDQMYNAKDVAEMVPARDFTIGSMTGQSLAVSETIINFGSRINLRGHIFHLNQTYTFVEVFDMSPDGRSGGLIQFVSGGVGYSEFRISIFPVSPAHPIRIVVVAYALDAINGGNNFRIGRFVPNLHLLHWDLLSRDAVAGQVSSLNARQAVAGNIAYVQSYDRVPRGRGALYLVEGGVGASNLAVFARSGDGQGILRTLEVYGRF